MSVSKVATRTVVTAAPGEKVVEVARRLDEFNVGTAVVLDERARPIGIVTDRDIAIRCVAQDHDPLDKISVIMSRDVQSVDGSTPIEEGLRTMARLGVRRLVVTDGGGKVVGLFSVDDVLRLLAEEVGSIGELLDRESPSMITA